jgi:hypothetical protein
MTARHRVQDVVAPRNRLSQGQHLGAPSTADGSRASSSQSRCRSWCSVTWSLTSMGSGHEAEIAERISHLALEPLWWPTVARLRAFRGIDTLTALSIHLELGADWQHFERPTGPGLLAGVDPEPEPVRRTLIPGIDHQDRIQCCPATAGRIGMTLRPLATGPARHWPTYDSASPSTSCRRAIALSSASTASTVGKHAARLTTRSWSRSRANRRAFLAAATAA